MALNITYDGFGIIANADGLTDSAGGVWGELGGGTISSNPDVYLYGSSSIGSQYASKTGYTYFTKTTPLDLITTYAGQFIYFWVNISAAGAFDIQANLPFNLVVGDATGSSLEWNIASSTSANGWTGGWKLFVIDITKPASKTNGAPNFAAADTFGVWIDTAVSVRADSIWLSQITLASGLVVTGTPTIVGNGFDEIVTWSTDYINRAAGMFQKRGNTYYSLGQLTIGTTTQTAVTNFTSTGDSIEYEASEYWTGTAWVTSMPATINNIILKQSATFATTATFQDTGISGYIDNKLTIDSSGGSGFYYYGGYLKQIGAWILKSGDIFDRVVISSSNPIKNNGATFNNITLNEPLSVTNGLVEIVNSADFGNFTNISYNNYTGKYAIYIPATITGTISFNNWKFDGTGTDIYWAGITGTLTIALTNGSNATTFATANPGVSTVVFENSVALTITGLRANVEIRIHRISDGTMLSGAENETELTFDYNDGINNYYKHTYSYNAGVMGNTPVKIQIISPEYEIQRILYTLTSSNASIPIQLRKDRNYNNPI